MHSLTNFTAFIGTDKHNNALYCESDLKYRSRGIWFDENPLDDSVTLMMLQVILVVIISRLISYILKPLGQTKYVCYLLGGIILGPSLIGRDHLIRENLYGRKVQVQMFDTVAEIGNIYTIFLLSLKLDFGLLRRYAKKSWKIGLGGSLFPALVTYSLIHPITGTVPRVPWLLPLITMSFSFFPVISQAMYELNLMSSELGQLAMSSAMLNDVLEWISIAIRLIVTQSDGLRSLRTLFSILDWILVSVYVLRPLMLLMVKNTPEGKEVPEICVVAMLLGVLVMAVISDSMGLMAAGGAILTGLLIPDGSPLCEAVKQKTEAIVSGFFLPIYIFRVGISVDVHALGDPMITSHLQKLIPVLYISKIVGITIAGLFCKLGFRNSFILSMIMSMKGIIELNIWKFWNSKQVQAVDDSFFSNMVLSSLGLTMIVTAIVKFLYKPQMRLGVAAKDLRARNIQSTLKDNEAFRILFCVHNEENASNIITLLEASNPTEASPICAYIVHTVESDGHSAPQLTPSRNRTKFRATTNQTMQAFENYSTRSEGLVAIEAYSMIGPYNSMHEHICRLAQENLVPLIIVPFHENHRCMVGPNMTGPIRQFNHSVQDSSLCTIGILVDRRLGGYQLKLLSSNVAVFFIGGPDDREALAFASRMADNPNVRLNVFRIILRMKKTKGDEEDSREIKLDKSLINEFKLRNAGNDRLIWYDIGVENCVEVMGVVRNSQGVYDLVMVGRRHPGMSLKDEEMTDFIQNPELGMIGDMLASTDFCDGMVDVLVMQESREMSIGAYRKDSILCTQVLCSS